MWEGLHRGVEVGAQSCSQSNSKFEIQPIRRGNTTKRRLVKQSDEDFSKQDTVGKKVNKMAATRKTCVCVCQLSRGAQYLAQGAEDPQVKKQRERFP